MSRSLTALSLTALMFVAGMATAQQSDEAPDQTEEAGQTTQETGQAAPQSPELDMGQPVQQGPAVGQRYVKETHGDWNLACIRTDTDNDPCSLVQVLLDDTDNAVAEVSLFRLEGAQAVAGATVIVPLETFLPGQLTISVDGGAAKRYNYQFCNQVGCIAQIGLTQADVDAFKAGRSATVTLVPAPAPDQPINLTMSLSGFTAGFDVVDVVSNQ
ncbi:invasion associated locus B family protein [Marinibacterium profundimaris]|uniref:Invasion protein n=1 Tax=Marinibacterium profundimaris TaxID=1679460 RepID=A0A225NR42_9RHOB|nr:invasion associated locus B family protein [Marinibacterium profundimaris]OWU77332.1 invasion protein [Marinibacterium profundimaris]